jgi:deoxyadenosine/deoxycytidine kinase
MYIIEGNIGAGKSTFLKLINKQLPYVSIGLEPLNNWHTEESGKSLLRQFYEQPKRWAYTLETLALMSRVQEHMLEQKHTHELRIVERSIYSGFYCFAQNSYQSGFLTDIEWSVYKEWFHFLADNTCSIPQGFVYLKVDPEIALERIRMRNRSAESGITLSYLKDIDKLHSDFLLEKKNIDTKLKDVPVLVLDCNTDFEHNSKQLEQLLQNLGTFLLDNKAGSRQHPITHTL